MPNESMVTQNYYIKEDNRDLLQQRALDETTIRRRVTDDMLLDGILDQLRNDPVLFDRLVAKSLKSRETDKAKSRNTAKIVLAA